MTPFHVVDCSALQKRLFVKVIRTSGFCEVWRWWCLLYQTASSRRWQPVMVR